MDAKNRFLTPGTYNLTRLEYLFLLMGFVIFAVVQRTEINWWIFAAMIVITDAIGYVPGAIAHRRQDSISPVYYILYNTTHSLFFVVLVVVVWRLIFGPDDWTLLAMPIHLCADRAVFGNFFKPIRGGTFEPEVHPAFAEFEKKFEQSRTRGIPQASGQS